MSLKFVKVEEVPEVRGRMSYNNLQAQLEEFMKMDAIAVTVDHMNHYKTPRGCVEALRTAIKRGGFPIIVTQRSGEIYLIKRDM